MVRKCYPGGKTKGFNVTYDDGVLQDVPLVELLNRYQLKGTFHLNSQLMREEFVWVHESGRSIKRLSPSVARTLYEGHEVASHTLTHPSLHALSPEAIWRELREDKANLEELVRRPVKGFAVPFDYYDQAIADLVRRCGFSYGRISEESRCFAPPREFYHWRATVFHLDGALEELAQRFLTTEEELAWFQIVGHSYDLDVYQRWDQMEALFGRIHGEADILPMTTLEAVEYVRAMEQVEITPEGIHNPSDQDLWFSAEGETVRVPPGGDWTRP